jgi:hypothetical protein
VLVLVQGLVQQELPSWLRAELLLVEVAAAQQFRLSLPPENIRIHSRKLQT